MSLIASIFGKSVPVSAAAAPAPVAPPPPVSAENTEAKAEENKSRFDSFNEVFRLDQKDDEGKPAVDSKTAEPPADPFETDPKKLYGVASGIDFTKAIDEETLGKIQAGGADAQAAFLTAMNKMAQMSYAFSAMHSAQAAKLAVKHTLSKLDDVVPNLVRDLQVDQSISDDDPVLSHPAAKPLIAAVARQIQERNPDMSAKKVLQQARNYLKTFGSVLSAGDNEGLLDRTGQKVQTKGKPAETDWDKLLLDS